MPSRVPLGQSQDQGEQRQFLDEHVPGRSTVCGQIRLLYLVVEVRMLSRVVRGQNLSQGDRCRPWVGRVRLWTTLLVYRPGDPVTRPESRGTGCKGVSGSGHKPRRVSVNPVFRCG